MSAAPNLDAVETDTASIEIEYPVADHDLLDDVVGLIDEQEGVRVVDETS